MKKIFFLFFPNFLLWNCILYMKKDYVVLDLRYKDISFAVPTKFYEKTEQNLQFLYYFFSSRKLKLDKMDYFVHYAFNCPILSLLWAELIFSTATMSLWMSLGDRDRIIMA